MDGDFYQECELSSNYATSWFHRSRNEITGCLVSSYFFPGATVMDLGCGNVLWNKKKIPVIGVDVNKNFLDYNMDKGTICRKILSPIDKIETPDNSADIIVITEVLEHIADLGKVLGEIGRILKPGGILISSVPYDKAISLWRPLFFLQCFYQGSLLGDDYYKQKCGHINHFSPRSIKNLLQDCEFQVLRQQNNFYLTIFTVAKKI